jgi:hypothetical protein
MGERRLGKKQKISHGRKTKQKHSHGLTRKNTEGRTSRSESISHERKNKQKQKNLPRNDTEKHGIKTLRSEPDA